MLHPSYQELIDELNAVNKENELPEINSRYGLVIAAAKRARALVDGEPATVDIANSDRKLSVAVAEMAAGNIAVRVSEEAEREKVSLGDGISLMSNEAVNDSKITDD